jgi:hypothetical protein
MSVPPDMAVRLGYFGLRVRTHEWAQRQRVSLLDVHGLGKTYLRVLYDEGLSTASRIMAAPSVAIARRLRQLANFPQDSDAGVRLVEDWKCQIVKLWRTKTGEPPPRHWTVSA